MKNYLKFLLVFILVLACTLSFAACSFGKQDTEEDDDSTGETGGGDENGGTGDNNQQQPPEQGGEEEEGYRIRFAYSYTALVVNSNGREIGRAHV